MALCLHTRLMAFPPQVNIVLKKVTMNVYDEKRKKNNKLYITNIIKISNKVITILCILNEH